MGFSVEFGDANAKVLYPPTSYTIAWCSVKARVISRELCASPHALAEDLQASTDHGIFFGGPRRTAPNEPSLANGNMKSMLPDTCYERPASIRVANTSHQRSVSR